MSLLRGVARALGVLVGGVLFLWGCRDESCRSPLVQELPGKIAFGSGNGLSILVPKTGKPFPSDILSRYGSANPTWDYMGQRLVLSLPDSKGGTLLFTVKEGGDSLAHLLGRPGDEYDYPSVSPDGKSLALISAERVSRQSGKDTVTNRILVTDMPERRSYQLLSPEVLPSRPSWSPDSKRLMFASSDSFVIVLEIESYDQDTLWRGTRPSWSPDGLWVAYYDGKMPVIRRTETGEYGPRVPRLIVKRGNGGPIEVGWCEPDELAWSPESEYLLFRACPLGDMMGTGTVYMVLRMSDGATQRLTCSTYVPMGACWFR